ncbi:hypothetical protein BP5796_03939 [Coleophoma crateriformis]|uniref:Uncharacterized protein n=1 Tax=Coleophoma crateriformis TaxID=565419 RepID=A0A3D8SHH9_9HELO|nr:hypothetical protein BP5796_03939 [Coleophoma crateriformis]
MSTTTVTAEQLSDVLQDYQIHLTGGESIPVQQSHSAVVGNPANWPTDRNRIPPYRPINRHLDMEQRPLGSNAFENAFLFAMFSGVVANASIAKFWGKTLGPVFPGLFKYSIGGEW